MTLLLVALGAMLGAPCRYLVDRAVQARHSSGFPWGTLTVNVSGSFLLGLFAASALTSSKPLIAFLGTGFCGAFTTYSTFGLETLRLAQTDSRRRAAIYALASIIAAVTAVYLGLLLADAFL